MTPTDLEDRLFGEPFVPLRITLCSGDRVVVDNPLRAMIAGSVLYYAVADEPAARIGKRMRVISIPNITLIEPVGGDGRGGR